MIFLDSIKIMIPFLLAAVGGLLSELAGVLNIALEGLMLSGAFFAVYFTYITGNLYLGILAGIFATTMLAFFFAGISLYSKANIFITGLATNLLITGLILILSQQKFKSQGTIEFFSQTNPHLVAQMETLFHILLYLSFVIVIIVGIFVYYTPFGLRIRAVGLHREAAIIQGINPIHYQMLVLTFSGFTCAIAGSLLALRVEAYVPNITSGRGWIALVVIYLGQRKISGILIASFIFGLAERLSIEAQGSLKLPPDIIHAFPYLLTVVLMVFHSIWKSSRAQQNQ